MRVELRPTGLDDPVVVELITALNEEIQARYAEPVEDFYFQLDPEEVDPGHGVFVVAWADRRPVGCGAVRLISTDTAELKRMYVIPEQRRRGVAAAVLRYLETQAVNLGAARVVLETVADPPAAMALYRAAGYDEIPKFGPYIDSGISHCLGKTLSAP